MRIPEKPRAIRLIAVLVLAGGLVAWRLLTLYSPSRPFTRYLPPVREFLAAAAGSDSAALARADASDAAIEWALAQARRNPEVLRALSRGLGVSGGDQAGESTIVLFRATSRGICLNKLLGVTFVGTPAGSRIASIGTECGRP